MANDQGHMCSTFFSQVSFEILSKTLLFLFLFVEMTSHIVCADLKLAVQPVRILNS